MVPDGWKEAQLGEFMSFKNGVNASKDAYGSGTKFVNVMDVFGTDRLSERQIIGEMVVTDKQLQDYSVLYGDVLFNRTSETQHEIALTTVYVDEEPVVFGGFVIRGRQTEERLLPEFSIYAFQSESIRREMIRRGQGAVRANIGQKDLIKVPMLIPPKVEQRKLAEILTNMDQVIEITKCLISNSERQKTALMQQLLTGKKRLKGFSEEWDSYKLSKLEKLDWIELGRGKIISKIDIANNPGPYPIYSSSIKNRGIFGYYGDFLFDEELISWSVDGGGHFFHRAKHRFSVTNVSGWLRIKTQKLNYGFLAHQLQMLHSQIHFDYQSKAHPSVIRELYTIKVPPIEEQMAIALVLKSCSETILGYQQNLANLNQEKAALVQQLLTGKRRVKIDGEIAA